MADIAMEAMEAPSLPIKSGDFSIVVNQFTRGIQRVSLKISPIYQHVEDRQPGVTSLTTIVAARSSDVFAGAIPVSLRNINS